MTNRPFSLSSSACRKSAIGNWQSAIRRAALTAAFAFSAALSAAAPLTLESAIELALENNQRLKVSAFSPEIARANVLAAYGAFDPAITFRRTYSEDEVPGPIPPLTRRARDQVDDYSLSLDGLMPWGLTYSIGASATNHRGTFNSFADNYVTFGGISVTQPLLRGFGFGATLANLRVAKASRGISDWQHRQTIIDTITNVVIVYNSLQQARENAGSRARSETSRGNSSPTTNHAIASVRFPTPTSRKRARASPRGKKTCSSPSAP